MESFSLKEQFATVHNYINIGCIETFDSKDDDTTEPRHWSPQYNITIKHTFCTQIISRKIIVKERLEATTAESNFGPLYRLIDGGTN